MKFQLTPILLTLFFTGCQTTPKNDDPTCAPCENFVNFEETLPYCPIQVSPVNDLVDSGFSNLVLEGGGVKGVAYVGAFAALRDAGRLKNVERVAGTSAGSLLALMLSLGYTPEQMQQIVLGLDFKEFKDGSSLGRIPRLIKDYGLYKGNYAQCVLECLVEKRTGNRLTTFSELHAMKSAENRFLEPTFFSTNVSSTQSIEFSRHLNADVPIAVAARMSMSIPYFFTAREYQNSIFVDGGVLRNYPIDHFDGEKPNANTLGLHLGGYPKRANVENVVQYTEQIFRVLMNTQTAQLCDMPENVRRSVFLDTLGISTTDFNITREQKCDLMNTAYQSTNTYLSQSSHSSECPAALRAFIESMR